MSSFLLLLLVLAASTGTAILIARRLVRAQSPALAPADVADGSDPMLALVLRANHALGVWAGTVGGASPVSATSTRLQAGHVALITARLARLTASSEGGTELFEAGSLVVVTDAERHAAALLPAGVTQEAIAAIRRDLRHLLDELRRRPVLAAVERQQGRPEESVESIAMRLGHQIERLLDTDVAIAVVRPVGVQVMGVSLRSDPRLLLALAAPESPLERVGRGIESGPLATDDPLGRAAFERRRARPRAMVLPIPGASLPVGAVVLATPDGALPGGELLLELHRALGHAGPRLAAALERRELEETALSDPLTGLRNRRGLDAALARVERPDGAMIVADLDHFKRLNDTLGHPAGDAALVYFARLVVQRIRTGDVPARIGGEEFAIWLPGATLLEGTAAAERIRSALEETAWGWQGKPWPLTASFGIAASPETVPFPAQLAGRADQALYEAKRAGRNRVVTAL